MKHLWALADATFYEPTDRGDEAAIRARLAAIRDAKREPSD